MNTIQLSAILRNNLVTKRHFLGVYAADKIPTHPIADTCFVANTDPHTSPGRHWVAFYVSPSKRVYYFDSFGLPPKEKSFKEYLGNSRYRWHYNKKQLQSLNAITCGHHCVHFLLKTCRTKNPQGVIHQMSRLPQFNDKLVYQKTLQTFTLATTQPTLFL